MRVRPPSPRLAVVAAAALSLMLVSGARTWAKPEAWRGVSSERAQAVRHCFRHVLRLGMTKKEALESDWCYPNDIESSTNSPGKVEYWFYGQPDRRSGAHTGLILFDHGLVTYFSDETQN